MLFASAVLAQRGRAPVVLEPGRKPSVMGQMDWLKDASARMTLDEVRGAQAWAPASEDFNAGYVHGALWMRLEVEQPQGVLNNWILEVGSSLIDDVCFYTPDGRGGWREDRAGRHMHPNDWPILSRTPSVRLQLPEGRQVVYLRMQSVHTLATTVHLLPARAYFAKVSNELLVFGAYFGLLAGVIVVQVFLSMVSRETLGRAYLPYLGVLFAGVLLSLGYLNNTFGMDVAVYTTLISLLPCALPLVQFKVTLALLNLKSVMPRVAQLCEGVAWGALVVSSSLVLWGHYAIGVQAAQVLSALLMLASLGLAAILTLRRHPNAGFYLLVFGVLDIGLNIRYLYGLGVVGVGPLTENAHHIGIALHVIAMGLFFIYRYGNMKAALVIERTARQEQRDFLGMVSHEFRTPLAIVSTSVQQLASHLEGPLEKSRERCSNILQAARSMTQLLDEYLSQDRLDAVHQALRHRLCDPYELLEEAASDWPVARVRIRAEQLPDCLDCDPGLLGIALRNLLANADRHAPPDRPIVLTAEGDARGGLRITVEDQGEGIPADELPQVFQKYFRGRLAAGKPGAGLGLYLVRQIVEAHGGRIEVRSVPGVGTRFQIHLPPGGVHKNTH